MDALVIGGGAVGMLTSCLLKDAGWNVSLVVRRPEQADAIRLKGVKKDGIRYNFEVTTAVPAISRARIVFIAVKHGGLESIRNQLKQLPSAAPLIFMQNGMLHLDFALHLPQHHIAVGSVEHGVRKDSDTAITHTGKGTVKLALLKGAKEVFLPLLQTERFAAEWHEDADRLLFRKVLLNCLINPLTAILEIQNGQLLTNPFANRLMRQLYMELSSAYPNLEEQLSFAEAEALCRSTAANTSSMLADKQAGRKMELDTIIGYTLNRTERDIPLLRSFYYLLKATEVDT